MDKVKISRALISVFDKTGIVELASSLAAMGVTILSTGGTYKLLSDKGIAVSTVDSYTGFPEIMDGRVKTLHPKIHGGLLAVRENPAHVEQMKQNQIQAIDLVVVNLYPFKQTIAKPGVSIEEVIENIDIGGPAMIRSAAKNHAYVAVVTDPADYAVLLTELKTDGSISLVTRKKLAVKAFRHTADYDSLIDTYLSKVYLNEESLRLSYHNGETMRYGENPHQKAFFFKDGTITEPCVANARQLHGKELSYNNIVDADAALEAVKELWDVPAASVIKHTNACGYATGTTLCAALAAAWEGDIVSSFGSVIAVTREVDLATAQVLSGRFVEVLIAPSFAPDALKFLQEKSSQIRLLAIEKNQNVTADKYVYKSVVGGMLAQDRDLLLYDKWETVTTATFPAVQNDLARFAWKACKHVKSNAIILAQEYAPASYAVIGMGAGQPNRIDSLRKLSATKAHENLARAYQNQNIAQPADGLYPKEFGAMVLASDAFFPFSDSIDEAHAIGIRYIVQPGGSKKDADVIAACNKYGIAMIFTGTRHFRH